MERVPWVNYLRQDGGALISLWNTCSMLHVSSAATACCSPESCRGGRGKSSLKPPGREKNSPKLATKTFRYPCHLGCSPAHLPLAGGL